MERKVKVPVLTFEGFNELDSFALAIIERYVLQSQR